MTTLWNVATSLEPSECLRLLRSARLGRVGMCTAAGPQVLPVNYTVVDGNILLRTDLYSAVAAGTEDATVAFEVDELDDRLDEGWSVLVVGRADHVEDRAEMQALFARAGTPWAPGSRPLVARIVPDQVTGRRFRRHE
jgi:nitroimidazol reductase NimA-like FMN-containing flavoprotein (pyridoxamine 5'-phosphate oxidase superfamily)